MYRRRSLQLAMSAGIMVASGCGLLQGQPRRTPRIGFLFAGLADARTGSRREAFVAGLHDYGYAESQTIEIEWRYLGSQSDAARELVGLPLDLIVSNGDPATYAVQQASGTIPIAFVAASD